MCMKLPACKEESFQDGRALKKYKVRTHFSLHGIKPFDSFKNFIKSLVFHTFIFFVD